MKTWVKENKNVAWNSKVVGSDFLGLELNQVAGDEANTD